MSGKVLNKMMGILGMEDDSEDFEELEEINELERDVEHEVPGLNKKSKIVNIHTASSAKVVIIKPYDYDEAITICDNFKNRKIVVVNTTNLEPKVGQRMIDFLGGASYALGGELQEIEKNIYLLSPSNVEVNNSLKNELSSKGVFSFIK